MRWLVALVLVMPAFAAADDKVVQLALPKCEGKAIGWKKVPEHHGKTVKELCGPCEVKYGRRCDKTVGALRCTMSPAVSHGRGMPTPGPLQRYDAFAVESCSAIPTGGKVDYVVWDSVFCDVPADPKAKLPSCTSDNVKNPPK